MMATKTETETDRIGLAESLRGEWIKLALAAVRDVGPAAQTLGGLLAITNRETFAAAAKIAERARLPVATVRKHLATLENAGWIQNCGRGRTQAGALRRTVTYRLTRKAIDAAKDGYGVLPWWACFKPRRKRRLNWSARAVLSVVMARLMSLASAIETQHGHGADADDFWGSVYDFGGENRFGFSLRELTAATGLSAHSVIDAKAALKRTGIVDWQETKRSDGGDDKDWLWPREEFSVVVTPTDNDRCYVDFDGG